MKKISPQEDFGANVLKLVGLVDKTVFGWFG